jgi:hypothetical protein
MILPRCQLANLVGAARGIVVPVMARSADNGGCNIVRKGIPGALEVGEERIRCDFRPRGGCWEDLRKTARGASSPAKPALHIPELGIVSSCPFDLHAYRAAVEGRGGFAGA